MIVRQRSIIAHGHDELQHIPEERRHTRKQGERCRNVLSSAVVVHDIRRLIENATCHQKDHGSHKKQAQREAEDNTGHDAAQSNKRADRNHRTKEREILLCDEGHCGETEE